METKQKNPVRKKRTAPQTGTQKKAAPAQRSSAGTGKMRPSQTSGAKQPVKNTAPRKSSPTSANKQSQSRKKPAAQPRKKPAAQTRPAYDASETLTSGKRRTSASRKQTFSLQQLLGGTGEKKKLSREEQSRLRQEKKADAAEKKRRREEKHPSPVVIYTQPLPFNSSRLLVQLLTVTAVVVALILGLSVFFKVENVVVHGAGVYSAWAVREASGISEGDNLLTFSRARANGQIQAKLPYVNKSRIGIKLPDTVNIYIEETSVAYAIQSEDGIWWLMNSDGRLVEQIDSGTASKHTKVLGVTLTAPAVNEQAMATENVPDETDALGEIIPVTVTGAQRLRAVLSILSALEANDIVGDAASVDVTTLSAIELWYGTRYQVNLGDSENMDYKIASMYDVILQLSNYQTGKLDCSFTTFQTEVAYTPFE